MKSNKLDHGIDAQLIVKRFNQFTAVFLVCYSSYVVNLIQKYNKPLLFLKDFFLLSR